MLPHMSASTPFHLAFPVDDLAAAETFYGDLLGCAVGRRAARWVDLDFFGHQITAHLSPAECRPAATNPVDGKAVPVRHFGVVLDWAAWEDLAARLESTGIEFLIRPHIRFRGKPGEQGTFFICDPAGNALEFKTFREKAALFAPGEADDHA